MTRLVMHLDMDAFFAAVEQRDHPEYRGKPLIVGALPGGRGVVSTCSYEARKFGVHSAMPIATAYKKCPHGIYIRPNGRLYAEVSRQVMDALRRISPVVEVLGIDEAFVDVTGLEKIWGDPQSIGRAAKRLILECTGVTGSVGIGPNRLIAKLASDFQKPDGLTVVLPEQVLDWLAPMPVAVLRGVGPKMQKELTRLGIRTVAQLRSRRFEDLKRRFGEKGAAKLYHQARGMASDRVGDTEGRKSISKERTFGHDVTDSEIIRQTLLRLASDVGRTARRENLAGLVITLKIRFPPFETHTKQISLEHATNSDRVIFGEGWRIYKEAGFIGRPVRLIGIGISEWEKAAGEQMDMLFVEEKRDEKLFAAVDSLRDKFGRDVIGLGETGTRFVEEQKPEEDES